MSANDPKGISSATDLLIAFGPGRMGLARLIYINADQRP